MAPPRARILAAKFERADVTECSQPPPSAEDRNRSPAHEALPRFPMASRGHRGAALQCWSSALLGASLSTSANLIVAKLVPKIARYDSQFPPAVIQEQIAS